MSTSYTADWFRFNADPARRSAERILPVVLEHLPVESALDVGCGTGSWLSVLEQLGVGDVTGVDADWVDREQLEVEADRFIPRDLTEPLDLGRSFDLVLSLEVAEHLPPEAADVFVASLARHAPVVLFSAAIPGQGGVEHVNEQWPAYWAAKFAAHDFVPIDAVRPRIWTDPDVAFWYVQNTLLFAKQERIPESLRGNVVAQRDALSLVHPRQFEWTCRQRSARRLFFEATIGPRATERLRRLAGRE